MWRALTDPRIICDIKQMLCVTQTCIIEAIVYFLYRMARPESASGQYTWFYLCEDLLYRFGYFVLLGNCSLRLKRKRRRSPRDPSVPDIRVHHAKRD